MQQAVIALLSAASIASFVVGVAAIASYPYHRRAKRCLEQSVPVDPEFRQQFHDQFGVTEITATSVPLFDVLYHTSKLDPYCLEGISHLHHAQHFQNLGSVVGFLHENIIPASADAKAWRGMIHKYQGYTGEQVEIDHLRHVADPNLVVPDSGTQPGYDVMVHDASGDLVPYQIKTVDTPAAITEHFQRHPDIDVIANREMGKAFIEDPHVHIDPTLSAQDAFHTTDATFHGIDSLGSWLHHIPMITLVAASVRHGVGVVQGRKSVADALKQTGVDVGAVGFGALGGSKVGFVVGLFLAPASGGLSLMVIPAITTIAGAVMGVVTGRKIGNWLKSGELRAAQAALKEKAASLRSSFLANFAHMLDALRKSYAVQDQRFRVAASKTQDWLERLLVPTVMTKFYSLARQRLRTEQGNARKFYTSLRRECRDQKDEVTAGLIIYAQGRQVFVLSEPVQHAWESVDQTVRAVEREKARLA